MKTLQPKSSKKLREIEARWEKAMDLAHRLLRNDKFDPDVDSVLEKLEEEYSIEFKRLNPDVEVAV